MNAHVILTAIALLIVFWAVGAYRRLSAQRKQCKAAFAELSMQLRQRHELVPHLADTAGGYLRDERQALERVIAADNEALAVGAKTRDNVFDTAAVARVSAAERELDDALTAMFAFVQRHPALQSDHDMQQWTGQLNAAENRIGFARQVYNDAAIRYNAARLQFPVSVIAFVFAFTPAAVLPVAQ